MSGRQSRHERRRSTGDPLAANGHVLVEVTEWVPDRDQPIGGFDDDRGYGHRLRYYRCRQCGQERLHGREFLEPCPVEDWVTPLGVHGYSIDQPRTYRALTEDLLVRFGRIGSVYEVASPSGNVYAVDVARGTCTCPDHRARGVRCKHLRRVDLEISAGLIPGPDGTFARTVNEGLPPTDN